MCAGPVSACVAASERARERPEFVDAVGLECVSERVELARALRV